MRRCCNNVTTQITPQKAIPHATQWLSFRWWCSNTQTTHIGSPIHEDNSYNCNHVLAHDISLCIWSLSCAHLALRIISVFVWLPWKVVVVAKATLAIRTVSYAYPLDSIWPECAVVVSFKVVSRRLCVCVYMCRDKSSRWLSNVLHMCGISISIFKLIDTVSQKQKFCRFQTPFLTIKFDTKKGMRSF